MASAPPERARGVTMGAGYVLREGFLALLKLLPLTGHVIASGMAAGTYALGKSAELYFFSGEVRRPEEFKDAYRSLPPVES